MSIYDDPRYQAVLDDLERCYGAATMEDDYEWVQEMVEASLESDDYWRSWGGNPR